MCRAGWTRTFKPGQNDFLSCESVVHRLPDNTYSAGRQASLGKPTSSRSPFDGGLLVHTATQERLLDFILSKAGYNNESPSSSVWITEPLGNALYSRGELIELMMESYEVPALTLAHDAPLLLSKNEQEQDGLAVDIHMGNWNTHVILKKNSQIVAVKRLEWGGERAAGFLHRLLSVKYPHYFQQPSTSAFLPGQHGLMHRVARCAQKGYLEEMRRLATLEGISSVHMPLSNFASDFSSKQGHHQDTSAVDLVADEAMKAAKAAKRAAAQSVRMQAMLQAKRDKKQLEQKAAAEVNEGQEEQSNAEEEDLEEQKERLLGTPDHRLTRKKSRKRDAFV